VDLGWAAPCAARSDACAGIGLPRKRYADGTSRRASGTNGLAGPGPAYPSLSSPGAVEFFYPPLQQQVDFYGSGWGGNKVLWWVARSYRGPVLIRGRQLDGPHLVRFDRGVPPAREIRIRPYAGGYYRIHARDRPSYTRLEAAGCYAYQIDGLGFSRLIVFEGRIVPSQP